jgi:exonuclease III
MGAKNFLVWNVRALHAGTHWNALRELVAAECLSFICIQETKLDVISNFNLL